MNKRFLCTRWLYLCLIGNVLLNTLTASAQCGCADHFETTFPAAVKEAPVVIEGELIGSTAFFGGDPTYLGDYRSNKIAVYKVLKGDIDAKEVELIQPNQHCSDCCMNQDMSLGRPIGIFFLYPSETIETPRNEIPNNLKFQYKTTWSCNFVDYNAIVYPTADIPTYNPYGIYGLNDINNKVYQVAKSITGQKYKEVTPLEKKHLGGGTDAKEADSQATAITSISPTTITAGTFDTLTIRGSGFTDWKVAFPNADDGGIKNLEVPQNHIVFTSDTLIKVLVPSVELGENLAVKNSYVITAGTGRVALTKNGQIKKSSQKLTVLYAESTYAFTDTSAKIYPLHLLRNTQNGDFMFRYLPSFRSNVAARHLFEAALEKWRCATKVNFTVSCDSVSIPNCNLDDNISTIAFRNDSCFANALLPGQKAVTQRKLRYCPNSDVVQLVAADIIFAIHPPEPVAGGGYQTLDWYYSGYTPGNIHSGQYDFASTALHELGHVQALDHVINSTELLHYYSGHGASGAINQLSPDTDILAGTEIINRSADTTLCFKGIKKVGNDCSLPDCADVGCGDAGYPLQAVFQLFPEHCLDNSYYAANSLQGSWYQMVATEVPVVAKDESMGSIVSRQWQIDTDGSPFDNMPCNDLSTMPDTCRSLYWTNPGDKKITLTVTDANGCSASYQEIISVQPECTDNLPIITQSRQICNPVVANCGSSDRNIQLRIARLDGLIGSGCYRYFISYHPTDPTVSTAQEVFTDADLQASDNPNEWQLNCLKAGYYRIQMTDEITACEAEQIIFLNNPEPVYPIIDQYQLQADAGCGACTGSIVLQTVNGNPDLEHYQFAWSVCDPPESCNVVQQNNLCAGAYAVTALDPSTGCSSTSNLSIDYTVPNNDGIVTGINIDVYPTVYTNNTNVRLSLPAAGEVTVEVFNFNGVLVKKLVDKVFYQQGEFIIPDNTSTLNDGLYLYRLKVCETYKSDIGIKY